MKHKVLTMLAAAVLLLATTGCSKDEQSPYINTAELEKNLVGVWWDEYKYADVTETGVPFTRVLLAVKADADHTGCIYLGLFDETDNLPLAVYGGPKDAGFRWQLLPNGDLQLSDPISGETSVFTRSADSYANSMTDVSTANLTYDNNQVTMTNGSYSGTLVKADAGQETDIQKRLTMPTATLSTNLNGEGTVSISDNPQNTWGR
jgi:hypothetical protein